MIEIEDQIKISLKLGTQEVFEELPHIVDVNVIEESGTSLPTATFRFRTDNVLLLNRLNEHNQLQLVMGVSGLDPESTYWYIQRVAVSRDGSEAWIVTAECVKNTVAKWSKTLVETSEEFSCVERIKEVIEKADSLSESNVDVSQDKQRWIQYGCSHKQHLDDIWLHCDFEGNGFPLIANTLEGVRFYNGKDLLRQSYKVKILYKQVGELGPSLLMDSEFGVEQTAGFLNSIGGRGMENSQFNVESGEFMLISSEPEIILANTEIANASSDFEKITNKVKYQSRNMHERYWEVYLNNLTHAIFFSSTKVKIFVKGKYVTMRPLDIVLLKDKDVATENDDKSVGHYSGVYVVSKIARRTFRAVHTTIIHLVRESNNFMYTG